MTIKHGQPSAAPAGLAQTLVLRTHAFFIGAAGFAGMIFDFRSAFLGLGPQGRVLEHAPHAGIGFVEAHGLAFVLAVILWRARPSASVHWVGFTVAFLLGSSNLIFWQMFVASDALGTGFVTTGLHALFAVLEFGFATTPGRQPLPRARLSDAP